MQVGTRISKERHVENELAMSANPAPPSRDGSKPSSDRSAALRGGPTSSTSIRFGMTLATILR